MLSNICTQTKIYIAYVLIFLNSIAGFKNCFYLCPHILTFGITYKNEARPAKPSEQEKH